MEGFFLSQNMLIFILKSVFEYVFEGLYASVKYIKSCRGIILIIVKVVYPSTHIHVQWDSRLIASDRLMG